MPGNVIVILQGIQVITADNFMEFLVHYYTIIYPAIGHKYYTLSNISITQI